MKKSIIITLIFILLLSVTSCYTCHIPTEGIWYCEEIGIALNFNPAGRSYAKINGTTVVCLIENEESSNSISVIYQDFSIMLPGYYMGKLIFGGKCIGIEKDSLCVESEYGDQYWFTRQKNGFVP